MTKSKKIILISLATIVIFGGVFVALEYFRVTDFVKINPTPQEQEDKYIDQRKKNLIESQNPSSDEDGSTDSTDTSSSSLEVSVKQENDNVVVLTKLLDYSAGTCTLTASNLSRDTQQTADIIYQPEFSSCAGFSIPVSTLEKGKWSITVVAMNSDGETQSKTVTLEVK